MTRRVQFGGQVHEFPDDATDAEISAALEQSTAQPRQRNMPRSSNAQGRRPGAQSATPTDELRAPTMPPRLANPADAERYIQQGARQRTIARMLNPTNTLAIPLVNTFADPTRRQEAGRTGQRLLNDLQEVPNLDGGQLFDDTLRQAGEGIVNLPAMVGGIVRNAPEIARGMTVGPFLDAERATQEMLRARSLGDYQGAEAAAREANAQTGAAATNVVGFGAGPLVRTPLQAAGLGAGLTAPHAFTRGDPNTPLQERLPGAIVETTGAAAFGGAGQAGVNALSRMSRLPPQTGEMVARMERAGIEPSLAAANGGGISGAMTKLAGDNLAAGPLVRARTRAQLQQAADAAARLARRYGRPRSPEAAGRLMSEGVRRFARDAEMPSPSPNTPPQQVSTRDWSFASKAGELFRRTLAPIEANTASLRNTSAVLDSLRRRADAGAVRQFQADPTLSSFERTVQRLTRAGRDSLEAASPEDLAVMAREIEEARRATGNADQSLSSWVRRRGGIKDDRGDIRGMDTRGVGASSMINRGGRGRSIDDLATAAWEDGFFPGDRPPTAREFLDAIDRDTRRPGSVARPDAQGANTQARQVLEYYERQGIDTNLTGQRLQNALRPLAGVDEGGGAGATLRDLRELRRKIREAQINPGLGQTVDNAALQRLEAALTKDMYEAAGELAPQLQEADAFYRRGRRRIDNVLAEAFDADDPGAALDMLQRAARDNGNTRAIAALRGALKDDEWRVVAASLIERMGQPSAGATGATAQIGFSVQRFATAYRNMTPQARRLIFGGRGASPQSAAAFNQLADELDNFARVVDNLKGVESMANFSGSGRDVQNFLSIGGVVTSLPATLSTIAALGLLGEVLTNPRAVRWLTSAPRGPGANAQGMRRHLAALADLATRDPALWPVYNELAQSQAHESGGPDVPPPYPAARAPRALERVRP